VTTAGGNTLDVDERSARAMVFAPSPVLTVTVEARPDAQPEIHLHAGGQGVWLARMLITLGVEVRLCAPFGGETGAVLISLVEREGIGVRAVPTAAGNGAYVHDRRGGERTEVATVAPPALERHELDELSNVALVEGLEADVAVLGGPDDGRALAAGNYRRLAADLTNNGTPVVVDLSGRYLAEAVAGGVTVAKASHEDLIADGRAASADPAHLRRALEELAGAGAEHVIVSRADEPALASLGGRLVEICMPTFERVDHRGAGDSMTAGVAAALARGADISDAVRLGAAAGALNTTRHGLATGEPDLIGRLAQRVAVRPIDEVSCER
jgi:1-phosphofructokinase